MIGYRHLLLAGLSVATAARGADIIVMKDGRSMTGEVTRIEADGAFLKLGVGEVKMFYTDIARFDIDKPASYDAGLAALKAQNFAQAAASLKPLVDRYAGLPVPWIQNAMLRLADAYTGQQDLPAAQAVLDQFAKLYPQAQQSSGTGLQAVRVLVAQKNFVQAAESLQKMLDPVLKNPSPTPQQEAAAAEAYIVLGDCQRGLNKPDDALDSYLTVVALFDVDPQRTAEARYKAGQVFEETGNWKRAKSEYADLLQQTPGATFAADAKTRLAALTAAHPE